MLSVSWSVNQSSLIITTYSGISFERGVNICRVCEDLTRITEHQQLHDKHCGSRYLI